MNRQQVLTLQKDDYTLIIPFNGLGGKQIAEDTNYVTHWQAICICGDTFDRTLTNMTVQGAKKTLVVPDTVVSLQTSASDFLHPNIASVKIRDPATSRLKSIGGSFYVGHQFDDFFVPDQIEELGEYLFFGSRIKCLHVGGNSKLKKLGTGCFSCQIEQFDVQNDQIKNMVLTSQSELKQLTSGIYLYDLETAYLPDSLEEIGQNTFTDTHLQRIFVPKGSKLRALGRCCFENCQIEDFDLPDGVEEIGDFAFHNTPLKRLNMSANSKLKTLGYCCFDSCQFEAFELPDTVTEIKRYAFSSSQLKSFKIGPNSQLTKLAYGCFYESQLQNVTISKSVTQIGRFTVKLDSDLKVDLSEDSTAESLKIGPEIAQFIAVTLKWCRNAFNFKEIELPACVEEIEDGAFKNSFMKRFCAESGSILRKIGSGCFKNSEVECADLPDSLEEIGAAAFQDSGLAILCVGENSRLRSVGELCFEGSLLDEGTLEEVEQVCQKNAE